MSQEHRLRRVRVICQVSQSGLAKRAGASVDFIRHIERGDSELSPLTAGILSAYVGVSGDWLMGYGDENPATVDGKPFTRETFEQWRQTKLSPEQRAKQWVQHLSELIRETFLDPELISPEKIEAIWMVPGFPEAQGCMIKEAIKRAFNRNLPAMADETPKRKHPRKRQAG